MCESFNGFIKELLAPFFGAAHFQLLQSRLWIQKDTDPLTFLFFLLYSIKKFQFQSAGSTEYTNSVSAEGQDSTNKCPGYN